MKKVRIKGHPIVKGNVRDAVVMEIPVPAELNHLALSRDGDDWDLMCKSVQSRNGQGIKNCVNVDFIRINGVDKPFH